MIAALFVATGGVYFGRPDVDPWDITRDARNYAGPHPVVAHPPCGAWGVWARQGWTKRPLGEDDGCFASALASVRRFGGVIEHPACSSAWKAHGLRQPRLAGGWWVADDVGGLTCTVEQGHYGHRARKPTWLYRSGAGAPPDLVWGRATTAGNYNNISTKLRVATPPAFAELLLSLARHSRCEAKEAA